MGRGQHVAQIMVDLGDRQAERGEMVLLLLELLAQGNLHLGQLRSASPISSLRPDGRDEAALAASLPKAMDASASRLTGRTISRCSAGIDQRSGDPEISSDSSRILRRTGASRRAAGARRSPSR
jgi:hypothetical protein